MKLSKEEGQKLFLGILLLIGLCYGYSEFLLTPLQNKAKAAKLNIEALGPQITAARSEINKGKNLSTQLPEAQHFIERMKAEIPDGAPVAWFPSRLSEFFKSRGVDKISTRLSNDSLDTNIAGFRKLTWTVEAAGAEFDAIGRAIADLENNDALAEIITINVDDNKTDHARHRLSISIQNFARQ